MCLIFTITFCMIHVLWTGNINHREVHWFTGSHKILRAGLEPGSGLLHLCSQAKATWPFYVKFLYRDSTRKSNLLIFFKQRLSPIFLCPLVASGFFCFLNLCTVVILRLIFFIVQRISFIFLLCQFLAFWIPLLSFLISFIAHFR